MDALTIDALTAGTLRNLAVLHRSLEGYLEASPNQRALLLGRAFASQLGELRLTVQRIVDRMPQRALKRTVTLEKGAQDAVSLTVTDDSRALTTWLVSHLQLEHATYQSLLERGRPGPAKAAATELAALFLAQSKRIALEAHRFQDL